MEVVVKDPLLKIGIVLWYLALVCSIYSILEPQLKL